MNIELANTMSRNECRDALEAAAKALNEFRYTGVHIKVIRGIDPYQILKDMK